MNNNEKTNLFPPQEIQGNKTEKENLQELGELAINRIASKINSFIKSNRCEGDKQLVGKCFITGNINISLQASRGHSCEPKEDDANFYNKVEFANRGSIIPDYIKEVADTSRSDGYEEIYGYVPIELIARWIIEQGDMGFKESEEEKAKDVEK